MFSKIASITLPIFSLVLVGFLYSRRVKPDLRGANKLVVDIALPVLIFISLSAKSFDPISALSFTGASIVLILLTGLMAWPLTGFSGASLQAFLPCAMFTNVGPIGIPLIALAYGQRAIVIADRAQAIAHSVQHARVQDVVLVAGKGHEDYQDIAGVKHPFSDVLHAREALSQRRSHV